MIEPTSSAEELASRVVESAAASTEGLLSQLRSHEDVPEITGGIRSLVFLQFITFGHFWIDRTAFIEVQPPKSDRLMELVTARLLKKVGEPVGVDNFVANALRTAIQRWAPFPLVPPTGKGPTGTLFWEFAKEVAELVGRPNDAEAIDPSMVSAAMYVRTLDPKGVFARTIWTNL